MCLGRRINLYFHGGDIQGKALNPKVTQARGLRETAGRTTLAMGAVVDGEYLKGSRRGTKVPRQRCSPDLRYHAPRGATASFPAAKPAVPGRRWCSARPQSAKSHLGWPIPTSPA